MILALWILNVLLAVAFLGAGMMKILRSKQQLKDNRMGWVDDFSAAAVRLIGIVEVLGAAGLILPLLTEIFPILTPVAATGLAIAMGVGISVHARRKEPAIPALVLAVLSVISAALGYLVVFEG